VGGGQGEKGFSYHPPFVPKKNETASKETWVLLRLRERKKGSRGKGGGQSNVVRPEIRGVSGGGGRTSTKQTWEKLPGSQGGLGGHSATRKGTGGGFKSGAGRDRGGGGEDSGHLRAIKERL